MIRSALKKVTSVRGLKFLTRRVTRQKWREEATIRSEFDSDYYLKMYPDVKEAGVDPVRHYLEHGWVEGRNPTPRFSTLQYLSLNDDVRQSGMNPFYHYIVYGRAEQRPSTQITDNRRRSNEEATIRSEFDSDYYLKMYPDVKKAGVDPVRHYLEYGWMEGRNPTPNFSTTMYLALNDDIRASRINPFYHYIVWGRDEQRLGSQIVNLRNDLIWSRAQHRVQDITLPRHIEYAEKLFVIIVPEHNTMSGGIYSFFSIAKAAYNIRHKHDYSIALMTRPNPYDITYLRQSNFRNSEDVFRFSQITRCRKAKELYLQIPEYAAPSFIASLRSEEREYLLSRDRLYVNILNQKIEIMPEKEELEDLRAFAHELTQSVAHHAYFNHACAERYDLPTLLLPPYTDLSAYEGIARSEKQRVIIYSPDEAPHREPVLKALRDGMPDYQLVEINGITFDRFMDFATRCLFSISFGEGFDGYVAQPIHQGGIGFAVYRDEYFPTQDLREFPNFFPSEQDMIDNVVARLRLFESDDGLYRRTNKAMLNVYEKLYSKGDYMRRIEKLLKREFEIFPREDIKSDKGIRL